MRLAPIVLALLAATAHAAELSEFGLDAHDARPATQLVEETCTIAVDLRGAIASVEVRERIANHGASKLGAIEELELPHGAQLIGLAVEGNTAVGVPAQSTTEVIDRAGVVGADPAIAEALPPVSDDRDRDRYRVIVEPFERGLTLVTRWTAIAAIRAGALHLVLPARFAPCLGSVRVAPGPGASVAQIRIGGATRGSSFVLDASDLPIDVELAFASREPIIWSQTEDLGDGWTAQALTLATPVARSPSTEPHRTLLVIDGSRSMQLIGTSHVVAVVDAIGKALQTGSELEAIVYDRTPARVLHDWKRSDAASLAAIEAAVLEHPADNGSDITAALALASQLITDEPTDVIVITDGVFGEIESSALAHALEPKAREVDVHAIVLDPGHYHSPGRDALNGPVELFGGTYVEVGVDDLDRALGGLRAWLEPAWVKLEVATAGATAASAWVTRGPELDPTLVPDQLDAGSGFTLLRVARKLGRISVTGRIDKPITVAARTALSAPIAQLVLASTPSGNLVSAAEGPRSSIDAVEAQPDDARARAAEHLHAKLLRRHPAVDDEHALAVLATGGEVARQRRAMVAGGGPYTRLVELDDPPGPTAVTSSQVTASGGSAIDRATLERMFQLQLQPKAYACYQRALVSARTLAGTATLQIDIGRGEITRVTTRGLGNAAFDACLVDAAYDMTPPLPTPGYNVDDRTIARYPLTFSVHADKPLVVPGDADSDSPLDIQAIQRGKPRAMKPVDTSTPLGNLRPTPNP